MPDQRQAEAILTSLRGVERELELAEPGSPEAEFLHTAAARLRMEYEHFVEDVRGHGRPEPPAITERPDDL